MLLCNLLLISIGVPSRVGTLKSAETRALELMEKLAAEVVLIL